MINPHMPFSLERWYGKQFFYRLLYPNRMGIIIFFARYEIREPTLPQDVQPI
jgi:hypothetical protein